MRSLGKPVVGFVAAQITGETRSMEAVVGALAVTVGDDAATIDDAGPDAGHA